MVCIIAAIVFVYESSCHPEALVAVRVCVEVKLLCPAPHSLRSKLYTLNLLRRNGRKIDIEEGAICGRELQEVLKDAVEESLNRAEIGVWVDIVQGEANGGDSVESSLLGGAKRAGVECCCGGIGAVVYSRYNHIGKQIGILKKFYYCSLYAIYRGAVKVILIKCVSILKGFALHFEEPQRDIHCEGSGFGGLSILRRYTQYISILNKQPLQSVYTFGRVSVVICDKNF